jgi:tRNA threonylcarbamoyladenosine biosynthesis protein TsaE
LVNEYRGRLQIYHIDAYRLDSVKEFEMLGFTDLLHAGAVVLIEWADKVLSCLQGVSPIQVNLEYAGEQHRRIRIKHAPAHFEAMIQP